VLVESRVLTLLVGSGDELVTLLLDPLPQTEFVLSRTKKPGLLFGVLETLSMVSDDAIAMRSMKRSENTHIVEDEQNLALSRGSRGQRADTTSLTKGIAKRPGGA